MSGFPAGAEPLGGAVFPPLHTCVFIFASPSLPLCASRPHLVFELSSFLLQKLEEEMSSACTLTFGGSSWLQFPRLLKVLEVQQADLSSVSPVNTYFQLPLLRSITYFSSMLSLSSKNEFTSFIWCCFRSFLCPYDLCFSFF